MDCRPGSDDVFGPRVDTACRPFDFTLLFEDVVLTCVPAAVLICVLPPYLVALLRQPCSGSSYGKLLVGKMVRLRSV